MSKQGEYFQSRIVLDDVIKDFIAKGRANNITDEGLLEDLQNILCEQDLDCIIIYDN